jgi:pimeloyl-ACP methyl ester carboxylesterase
LRKIILIIATLAPFCSIGQLVTIFGQDVERVYRTQDSTQNFYLVLEPKTQPKGLLVILPGFGGPPREVLEETDLPAKARKEGYVVIIPYLAIATFYSDSLSQGRLSTLIPEVIKKYKIPKDKFIIGGHSAGGNGALLYSESAYGPNDMTLIRPNGVFAVDSPLDLKRFWNSIIFQKKLNSPNINSAEGDYFLKYFQDKYGGTPETAPAMYEKYSSYYRDSKEGGNAKFLKTVPVRLYCDPDIQWLMDNKSASYEHLNAADLSALIVQLKVLGNGKAELITNIGKGYLPDGRRHPHAFSQLDSNEFLLWMKKILEVK